MSHNPMNTVLTLLSHAQIREHYHTGNWREDTIYDLVAAHAVRDPDRVAAYFPKVNLIIPSQKT